MFKWFKKLTKNKGNKYSDELMELIELTFYNDGKLSHLEQSQKTQFVDDFYDAIKTARNSDNPLLGFRGLIVNAAKNYSENTVLYISERYGGSKTLLEHPYISGELFKYIQELRSYNDNLDKLQWKHSDISDDDLISFCSLNSAKWLFYLRGLDVVRKGINDYDIDKDWLQPYITSMCIYEESRVRNFLKLEPLMDEILILSYTVFTDLVLNGSKDPYYEWDKLTREMDFNNSF